ncbi:hypothetical protein JNB91_19730 [Rhizobium wenxiniae]|uniref:hypothetical protein n=1 Tax=Rhizobium wenxiniae TaxID=1737357 RepID=UPI001C6F0E21|nr:hypothetical protein [Rhizobium wenxiniae]MBW9090043.1 hypothetical protein [Rhizobium wenxiniae]
MYMPSRRFHLIDRKSKRIKEVNTSQLVMQFIDNHQRHANRMRFAPDHVHPGDAATDLEWYRRTAVAASGPDPTQLLQRLPFVLKASEAQPPEEQVYRVFISADVLVAEPFDNFDDETDLVAIAGAVRRRLPKAHIAGSFRPYRFLNSGGMFLIKADFLIWGCGRKELEALELKLAREYERVVGNVPVMRFQKVNPEDFIETLFETFSVPDRQLNTEHEYSTCYPIALDFCAEMELKEILKKWSFEQLLFVEGEGERMISS